MATNVFNGGRPTGSGGAFDADDPNEYLIRSRSELTRLLEALRSAREPVAISLEKPDEFLVSAVLALDEQRDRMALAYGKNKQQNSAVLRMPALNCEAAHRSARLHFVVVRPEQAVVDGKPAFAVPLPEWICRLHRRRDLRVKVSPFAPLVALLELGVLGKVEVEVADISMTGIGMIKCPSDIVLHPGELLTGCAILLPGKGPIPVDLRVAYCKPGGPSSGAQPAQRIGCEFVAPAAELKALIRHYIVQLA